MNRDGCVVTRKIIIMQKRENMGSFLIIFIDICCNVQWWKVPLLMCTKDLRFE